jgi:Flp pilus assembly protein TadD
MGRGSWVAWIFCCLEMRLASVPLGERSHEQQFAAETAKLSYHRGFHAQYHLHDFSAALSEYEKAATLLENLSYCPNFDCSGMLNDLGVLRRNQGDLAGAEKAFLQSMEHPSNSIFPLANLAEIKSVQGDYHSAANYFLQATKSPEVTPEILYNYGAFL